MIFKTVQIQKCVGYILPENIFVIKNGEIVTPPTSASILVGITRNSIIKISQDMGMEIKDIEKSLFSEPNNICEIANDNAPGQVVLSGDLKTVEQSIEIAKTKGIRRAVLLPVSAPFHCSLMKPASQEFKNHILKTQLHLRHMTAQLHP